MTCDVIGWGALNMDILSKVNKISKIDDESYIKNTTKTCGGSAANTIIGLSRLEQSTGFIGKIGTDENGQILLNNLKQENVNTDHILKQEGTSGQVTGYIDEEGNRALYVDSQINDNITPEEIKIDYINNSKILHLSSFVGRYTDQSIETQIETLSQLNKKVKISIDPGMIYINKGRSFMDQILEYTDILFINKQEIQLLIESNNLDLAIQDIMNSVDNLVLKMGSEGSLIKDQNHEYKLKPYKTEVKDTTGAGDSYNAGFLYGMLNNYTLRESGILGNFIASQSIQKTGATEGLPKLNEIKPKQIVNEYIN